MRYRVGIIGKFGAGENWHDGQTVKTKNLTLLLEEAGNVSVRKVDTCYFRKKSVKLLLDTIRCMISCDHVFLMVAENGMRFYLPFLFYLNKLTHRKIYHYIIGSELLAMVERNKTLVKYLNALDVNWFEYESGTQELRRRGVANVATLANFKLLTPVEKTLAYSDEQGVFRFCTFSRVTREKGITEAVEAISRINESNGKKIATLDIYGPVEACYADEFERLLIDNKGFVSYRGIVDSQKSVDALKYYFAMLFPTRWPGEGVPGTIIDSFAAGLPIIASDWNANRELIEHEREGILYPCDTAQTLEDAILWAMRHSDQMNLMRHACRVAYDSYAPETVAKVIFGKMEGNANK